MTALTRVLSHGEPETSSRHFILLSIATLFSIHAAVILYRPSIVTIILGISNAIFLSRGFLLCEAIDDDSRYETLPSTSDVPSNKDTAEIHERSTIEETSFPQNSSFVIRLRAISFLLAILSTISMLTLCRLDVFTGLTKNWWSLEVAVVWTECGRWFLICYSVFDFVPQIMVVTEIASRSICCGFHLGRFWIGRIPFRDEDHA